MMYYTIQRLTYATDGWIDNPTKYATPIEAVEAMVFLRMQQPSVSFRVVRLITEARSHHQMQGVAGNTLLTAGLER